MLKFINNRYFVLILRIGAGLFLIYAAQSKIFNMAQFAQAIRAYEIIPDSLSTIPAIIIPWIELYCGLLLIAGFYTRSSAAISASLMLIFTINVLIALLRGLDIDCGCGASLSGVERVSWTKIIENIAVIAILIFINTRESLFLAFDNKRVGLKNS